MIGVFVVIVIIVAPKCFTRPNQPVDCYDGDMHCYARPKPIGYMYLVVSVVMVEGVVSSSPSDGSVVVVVGFVVVILHPVLVVATSSAEEAAKK